jgi:ubiquinone/menaquinone biosynthesis C-methylase UbiE
VRLIFFLLRPFYHLLYHQFAWTYDLVAWLVSLGRWNDWARAALPHLEGRVLELGFGPGHLQAALAGGGLVSFGLDESRQMTRQAARRLRRRGRPARLARGRAQTLPYAAGTFDTVVATFPSEYIFDARTLLEAGRVLVPGGKLVVLPAAWPTGKRLPEKLAAWLFRVTGQGEAYERLQPGIEARFRDAGFEVRSDIQAVHGGNVLVIVAARR